MIHICASYILPDTKISFLKMSKTDRDKRRYIYKRKTGEEGLKGEQERERRGEGKIVKRETYNKNNDARNWY